MIVSKERSVNPITGIEVPKETVIPFGVSVTEDADNIYLTDWDGTVDTFPKERWELK